MKTKKLLFLFVFLLAMFISQVNAQVTVKESFDYDAGDLNGLGVIENGWGSLWATGDGATTANVVDYNLCPGDDGNSILIDSATIGGAWGAQVKRDLETTWIDDGTTYWLAFYAEMIYKAKSTWWAVQLNLIDQEKVWFGTVNETGVFGAWADPSAINTEMADSIGAKAWLVLKMQMNGNTNADSTGYDTLFVFVNPDPLVEPSNNTADAWGVTGKLNDGFNNINVWSDGHYKMAFDRIILSTVYNDLGVVSGISKVDNQGEFSVYPTVTSGSLNVKYASNTKSKVDISVYSVTGQKMMTLANEQNYSSTGNHVYDVSNLSSGAYILTFSNGTNIYNRKFIVNK
jgi:hypothetical protein